MPWVEVLAVFIACHLTGDYLLQTNWQALNKRGGLGRDPERRRALLAHIATYTLAFVPALAVLVDDIGAGVACSRRGHRRPARNPGRRQAPGRLCTDGEEGRVGVRPDADGGRSDPPFPRAVRIGAVSWRLNLRAEHGLPSSWDGPP